MARQFNGSTDYLLAASSLSYGTNEAVAVSFWLWLNADSGVQMILESPRGLASGEWYCFTDGTGKLQIGSYPGGSFAGISIPTPNVGQWNHIVINIDQSNASQSFVRSVYLNGVSQTLGTGEGDARTVTGFASGALNVMYRRIRRFGRPLRGGGPDGRPRYLGSGVGDDPLVIGRDRTVWARQPDDGRIRQPALRLESRRHDVAGARAGRRHRASRSTARPKSPGRAAAATLSVSPASVTTSTTGDTITLTGTATSWTAGTPGSPTFTASAGHDHRADRRVKHVGDAHLFRAVDRSDRDNHRPSTGATASLAVNTPATATGYTFTGPTSGLESAASSNFTVTPTGGIYTGTITITPSGGGLSSPIVLTFSASSAAQTFTITPTALSTVTLTPPTTGNSTNPSALTYSVTEPSAHARRGRLQCGDDDDRIRHRRRQPAAKLRSRISGTIPVRRHLRRPVRARPSAARRATPASRSRRPTRACITSSCSLPTPTASRPFPTRWR